MKGAELKTRYDAVVLGGGPSGCAAAAALSRRSLRVLLIDEQKCSAYRVGESLPGIGNTVLVQTGFATVMCRVSQLKCSGNRSAWGSSEIELRPGILNAYGGGVHLDRAEFDREILNSTINLGAQVLTGVRFCEARRSKNAWEIFLGGRKTRVAACDSVIDCTGRRAWFARTQGAKRIVVDKQIAVVSILSGEGIADGDLTTLTETAPEGWWYSARIPRGRRVAIFFTDGDLLAGLRIRSCEGFASLMRQSPHMGQFLTAGYAIERNPTVVLADTSYLTHAVGSGWCAAGDAAAALDPLASAGIVDALGTGSDAANLVLSGFKNGENYSRAVTENAMMNLQTRKSYYLMETRWPLEPFWARRHKLLEVARLPGSF